LIAIGRSLVVLAEPLRQYGRDVLVRADLNLDRTAEHDLGGTHGGYVARVGQRQAAGAIGPLVGEYERLAQEAAGELGRERRSGDQLGQTDARQAVEVCDFRG